MIITTKPYGYNFESIEKAFIFIVKLAENQTISIESIFNNYTFIKPLLNLSSKIDV